MKSRVVFWPNRQPYGYFVEYRKDGWFQPWNENGSFQTLEDATKHAKTFQDAGVKWQSSVPQRSGSEK